MTAVVALPTWLFVQAARPVLPRRHPWKQRSPSLGEWAKYRTDLCAAFDVVFWLYAVCFTLWLSAQ